MISAIRGARQQHPLSMNAGAHCCSAAQLSVEMLVRRCTEPDMTGSSKASQFWDADAPFASASLVEMQKSPGLEGPLHLCWSVHCALQFFRRSISKLFFSSNFLIHLNTWNLQSWSINYIDLRLFYQNTQNKFNFLVLYITEFTQISIYDFRNDGAINIYIYIYTGMISRESIINLLCIYSCYFLQIPCKQEFISVLNLY